MTAPLLLLAAVLAIIFVKIVIVFYNHHRLAAIVDKIPGPKSYPLVGNALSFALIHHNERYKWFQGMCREYESGIFRVWMGMIPKIHLTSAEHVGQIFASKSMITKSIIFKITDPWLGTGLLTATGDKWHRHRKLITPTFHFNILEEFAVVMSEKAEILKQCIQTKLDKNPKDPIDMFVLLTSCALDIICESAMGVNINAQINPHAEFSIALHSIAVLAVERFFRPWLHNDWLYAWTSHSKRFRNYVNIVHSFTNRVINERKLARKDQQRNCDEDAASTKPKRQAFLDHLLDARDSDGMPLSDESLREEVNTFIFAGHDTTATAMSWALFCIGNHPEVEEKIHQEQLQVFGDSTEPATLHQISQLKYLERVIKETLRLFPSATAVTRALTEEMEIGGYKIPKSGEITIQVHEVHRDPKQWQHPDRFDPDRFLPENSQGRHPYAYVPFSAGLRNCIGQKFALLEQKIVLTAILRSWKVKSHVKFEDAKCVVDFILRPQNGMKIYLTPVNNISTSL